MQSASASAKERVLTRLSTLRQHQQRGQRSPHKPLLVLLALGRLVRHGTSEIGWSVAERELAELIRDYGRPTSTAPVQRAAYPFTHLRSDDIWVLDHDVPMDKVRPLREYEVVGRFPSWLEDALGDPDVASAAARQLVETEFPPTIAPDVLMAVGLDPDDILGGAVTHRSPPTPRRMACQGPRRVGPPVRLLRLRRAARRCAGRCRGRACPVVQLRRPGRTRQRARPLLAASQAVRPGCARP